LSDITLTPSGPTAPSAERRQVTVVFADMVGFTAISERLGEEGTYALIQPIYELMAGAVREQGGSVKDFTGDGIMALFGVPNALEDAPLRACRAGLLIHERLAAAATAIEAKHGVRPQMRIGINSGLAVVTQIRGESVNMTALGDTVNLASRLQTLAEPGTVLLSEATHRLVHGLVETSFTGAHSIKGKAEPQRAYRLDSIRPGATRFETAVGRGLSPYVGREREMDILERGLVEARSQLYVIDVVAEPGMGKSRLLHEFRQRIGKERVFVLSGGCSPDGQQTSFLPFIEVVRGSFRISAGEAEKDVAHKLEMGLTALGLHTQRNVGLLLHLLGLKVPDGALLGLDGLLIGLRTRELLQQLLEARCRLSPVVMVIEDLHWIDSASEEVLGKIVDSQAKLRLLLLHTRRPEYTPAWLDCTVVTKLRLEPLPTGDIRRLAQARLGVEVLPEALARQVTEKAEGNPLFAEELVSFLTERGMLRTTAGMLDFDASAVAAALPASVQSLLTARVDRLASKDRALLQAASVIGRQFDPQLLAAAVSETDIDIRLGAMQSLDLVRPEGKSGDYAFKHALVRDALYQSLLMGPRAVLHLKIAEEIERRGGNRLAEVAETLAHHYSQTNRPDKAFTYLAIAGAKSLGIYSLGDANHYFAAAIALLDKNPDCVSDQQVAELLADYALCLILSARFKLLTETAELFIPRLDRAGDDPNCVLVRHYYVMALICSSQYREAEKVQTDLSAMAARLRETISRAYALGSAIHLSTIIAPYSVEVFEELSREAMIAASTINDAYLSFFLRYAVGWAECHRGRMAKAHEAAEELMAAGRQINDPRSIGYGMRLHAFVALVSGDYDAALNFAETGMGIACTPWDQALLETQKVGAFVLLRRPQSVQMLQDFSDKCATNGWHQMASGADIVRGVTLAINGKIGAGIRSMQQAILRREQEGYQTAADLTRGYLCEIYLEIIAGNAKPSLKVIARNILTLVAVMFTAQKRILALVDKIRQNPQFDPNGQHIGKCEMILGFLYKAKKKRALAVQHLTEAKRIISQLGQTPLLARVDAALAELG